MKEARPEHVAFEMDVLWFVFPGQNPVQWLKRYPGRWQLMHLKDLRKGVETGSLTGGTDVRDDVPPGHRQVDWLKVLKTAQETGVKMYFIEDESPTVEDQISLSLRYLETVKQDVRCRSETGNSPVDARRQRSVDWPPV